MELVRRAIVRFLTSRFLSLYLGLAGILLTLPALWTGWQQDDVVHRFYLLGGPDPRGNPVSPLDIFAFLDGDSSTIAAFRDLGVIPWWTYDHLRLAFWRPLSGLTHWLDYELWPDSALLMHLQSLLWFGALIALVTVLYRRLLGVTWVAGLAALLFALDDTHGLAAGWLANRNALIAASLGMLALLVHDASRRGTFRAGEKLGPLLFFLALLAGETALGVAVYLFAYTLFVDRGTILRRVNALLPYGIAAAVWAVIYRQLGHGTEGSGFYLDPFSQPLAYLEGLLERGPILLMDQWAVPPSSPYMFLSADVRGMLLIWALFVCIVVGVTLVPLLRHNPLARFWCTGMLLSIPIVTATMPHSRLLIFAGLGGMGLLAMWVNRMFEQRDALPGWKGLPVSQRVLLVFFGAVHLLIAPVLLPLNAVSAATTEPWGTGAARSAELDAGIEQKDLILVNPPVVFLSDYFITVRAIEGLPRPQRQRILAPGSRPLHLERSDARTLVVRPEGGFLNGPFDDVFRAPALPFRRGDRVGMTNLGIEILDVSPDGRPLEVAFRFAERLEHSSLQWLVWEGGGWVRFLPPDVGQSVTLPAGSFLF